MLPGVGPRLAVLSLLRLPMSVRELLSTLARIEETVLLHQGERGRPRAGRMLTEMDDAQTRPYDLFGLDAYAPKRRARYYNRQTKRSPLTWRNADLTPNSQETPARAESLGDHVLLRQFIESGSCKLPLFRVWDFRRADEGGGSPSNEVKHATRVSPVVRVLPVKSRICTGSKRTVAVMGGAAVGYGAPMGMVAVL